MKVLRLLLLTLLLTLLPAAPAWAHAALLETTPADGTVLQLPPAEVTLRYSEAVGTALGSVQVLAPDGQRVDTGRVERRADGRTVVAAVEADLGHGTYTVLWRVVSGDSHPVAGASTFSVGHPSPAAAVSDVAAGRAGAAQDLLTVTRFVLYGGLVLLVGCLAFLLVLWRAGWGEPVVRRLVWAGWGSVTLASAAALLLQGPYAAGLPLASATDPALLADVLGTRFGVATGARLVLLAALALLLRHARRAPTSAGAATGAVLVSAILLSASAVGHAGAGDLRSLALPADALHLAAMSAWLGGLVLLGAVVLRRSAPDIAAVLPAWSRYAAASVVVLVVTGTFASWREVRELDALPSTTYGRLLLVKVALVAGMLALGAVGRAWVRRHHVLPVVHAASSTATGLRPAPSAVDVGRLRRGVLLEAGTAAVVLAITAVLVETTPARVAYAPVFTDTAAVTGPLRVQVDVEPARAGLNDVHVYYTAEGGKAVDVPEVTARWTRPGSDDVVPVELARSSLGHYERLRVALPTAGTWRLTVTTRTSDVESTPTRFTVRVR